MRIPPNALLTTCLLSSSLCAQTVIVDGDFDNWQHIATTSGSEMTVSNQQTLVGGNPGKAHFSNFFSIDLFGGDSGGLEAWEQPQPFDPASGAIHNLSFQFDARNTFTTNPLSATKLYPLLRQGGSSYVATSEEFLLQSDNIWRTLGPTGTLPDSDSFSLIVGPGTFNSSLHPDFSPTGALINFGYYAFNLGGLNGDSEVYLDNFSVTFDVVEPRTQLTQTPFQRNLVTVFTLMDADAFEVGYLYLSKTGLGSGPCLPLFGGLCLDISNPARLIGYALSDANGVAHFLAMVPPNAPLITIHTQVIIRRGINGSESILSNTLSETIMP